MLNRLGWTACCLVTLNGCDGAPESSSGPLSSEQSNLYFNITPGSTAHWPLSPLRPTGLGTGRGADIPVCYDFPSATGQGMRLGQAVNAADLAERQAFAATLEPTIENTWGRIADIDFHPWIPCQTQTSSGWLRVHVVNSKHCVDYCPRVLFPNCVPSCKANDWSHTGTVGYGGPNAPVEMFLDAAETRPLQVPMHEFGHALGFFHEFQRPDWTLAPLLGETCVDPATNLRDDTLCQKKGYGTTCDGDGMCQCTTDDTCKTAYGDSCVNGRCVVSATVPAAGRAEGQAESPSADSESIMAATYLTNTIDQDRSGIANPAHLLSSWDVIGVDQVYGHKARSSLVSLSGKCVQAPHSLGLSIRDCGDSGPEAVVVSRTSSTGTTAAIKNVGFLPGGEFFSQCWTIQGSTVHSFSTPIVMTECQSPLPVSQQFAFLGMQLRAMGNMCIDASGSGPGATLALAKCRDLGDTDTALDRWDWAGSSLKLSSSGLCVTMPSSAALGAVPTLQTCTGAATQLFSFAAAKIRYGAFCFNVAGGEPVVGSTVGLWDGCFDGQWNSDFYFTGPIHSVLGPQCLDLDHSLPTPGNPVNVYPCVAGSPDQDWDYHF